MEKSLSARIEEVCRAFPEQIAFLEGGRQPVSYANVFQILIRFSECLTGAGVKPGDHVVVATTDMLSIVTLKLALIRIGAVPIAVSPKMAEADGPVRVDFVVLPRAASCGKSYEIAVDHTWLRTPGSYVPVVPGGRIIHATSGTTGTPKLRNDSEETFLARMQNGLRARGGLDGPVFVAQNPGSLIGLKSVVSGLLEAQTVMPMMQTPEVTVAGIAKNRIRHAFIPPLHLKRLADATEETGVRTPRLVRINVGGGALSQDFAARCEELFQCEVYTDYGSTETDTIASYRASLTKGTPGLVGPIWDLFDWRFHDLDGNLTDAEEGGELFLRVPENMRTRDYPPGAELFDPEGWTSTGDIGRIDKENRLILSGRKSDLINIGGNKLAPLHLEQAMAGYPGLKELAAFRIPTGTGIDAVGFAVVAEDGLAEQDFVQAARDRISDLYEYHVAVVPELPMTETGKIDRKALSAQFSA